MSCWGRFGVILGSCWRFFEVSEGVAFKVRRSVPKVRELGSQVESKLASKLGQVGLKIDIQLHSNFDFISEGIWEPLGLDFGVVLGSKIEPKKDPKIRSVRNAKFDSRVGGSSIFDVPGTSKIDQKSMPKQLQDRT